MRRQAANSGSKIEALHFPGREPLTRREREVLEQFTAGASNKEAGRSLGISPRTIEDHRANIMKKLGAEERGGSGADRDDCGEVVSGEAVCR